MSARLDRTCAALRNFLDEELSEAHAGVPSGVRAHLESFRSFLLSFYSAKFGYYPPRSFDEELFRTMGDDFAALYALLEDDGSFEFMPSAAAGGICTLQMVQAFDKRNGLAPLEHPLPLLPRLERQGGMRRIAWLPRGAKKRPTSGSCNVQRSSGLRIGARAYSGTISSEHTESLKRTPWRCRTRQTATKRCPWWTRARFAGFWYTPFTRRSVTQPRGPQGSPMIVTRAIFWQPPPTRCRGTRHTALGSSCGGRRAGRPSTRPLLPGATRRCRAVPEESRSSPTLTIFPRPMGRLREGDGGRLLQPPPAHMHRQFRGQTRSSKS